MTQVDVRDAGTARSGYRVDAGRGGRNSRVSSEWFSRPDDERFLSLGDLYAAVRGRTDCSATRIVESAAIQVEASRDTPSAWPCVCRARNLPWSRPTGPSGSSRR